MLEVVVVVSIPDSIDEFLTGLKVTGLSASVKLVLKSMLDVQFQVLRDVVTMSYVSDPGHGHSHHELVCKAGQLLLEQSDDVTISQAALFAWLDQTLQIELLVDIVGESSTMIWSEVPLVSALNLSCVDEVEVGCQDSQAVHPEVRKVMVLLVLVNKVVC